MHCHEHQDVLQLHGAGGVPRLRQGSDGVCRRATGVLGGDEWERMGVLDSGDVADAGGQCLILHTALIEIRCAFCKAEVPYEAWDDIG